MGSAAAPTENVDRHNYCMCTRREPGGASHTNDQPTPRKEDNGARARASGAVVGGGCVGWTKSARFFNITE